jgi:intraflagellar transport protein 140
VGYRRNIDLQYNFANITFAVLIHLDVSKQPDLFILAANYLQSLNWRNQPAIMQHIIGFYTKAKAPESLSMFYDACAQVEIDDYKNYEKALGALKESGKYMAKSKLPTKDSKLAQIKKKIALIEQFLGARKVTRQTMNWRSITAILLEYI